MENEMVFAGYDGFDDEPFTTSKVIAKYAGVKHRTIQTLIQKYESYFEEFGPVKFWMMPLPACGNNQNAKVYFLNEPQAMLLLMYLKNTPSVRKFKEEFILRMRDMRNMCKE